MATIGDRLKAERLRLGLGVEAFGDAAGVGKHSQIRYEKGERSPDGDYLAKAFTLGVDVNYIVTGFRIPLGVQEDRATYFTPVKRVASEIQGMAMSSEDADLVLALAKRLDSIEGRVERKGSAATRTVMKIPATAENAGQPHDFSRGDRRHGDRRRKI